MQLEIVANMCLYGMMVPIDDYTIIAGQPGADVACGCWRTFEGEVVRTVRDEKFEQEREAVNVC
jgi:hypothetical protein